MKTRAEFMDELKGVHSDAETEREFAEYEDDTWFDLDQLSRAFTAMYDHIHGQGDLFYDTEAPTDEALLLIFAFLALP